MMKKQLISAFNRTDGLISKVALKILGEKRGVLGLLFHGIYASKAEIEKDLILPHQKVTVADIQHIIIYFLEREYKFISPDDILAGLSPERNYVSLSFDDGYANNLRVLPILQEYNIPAIFFVSISHCIENKCFWPDVLYRENKKSGKSYGEIIKILESLKSKKSDQIEKIILDEFGDEALTPINNIDRPFTVSELKEFSNDPLIFIGNHTSNHAILTNYSPDEIAGELRSAQEKIFEITGQFPNSVSFPNGNYTDMIARISYEIGLKLGFTTVRKKNYHPLELGHDKLVLINRFFLARNNLEDELNRSRSDIQLKTGVKSLFPGITDFIE